MNCAPNFYQHDQFAPHYGVLTESRTVLIIHLGLSLLESTLDSYGHAL